MMNNYSKTEPDVFNVFVVTQRNKDTEGEKLIEDNEYVIGVHKTSEGAFDAMHESVREYIKLGWRYLFYNGCYVYGVWNYDDERKVHQEISFNVEMMTLKD